MISIESLVQAFLLIFIPLDVFGNIPVFIMLTEKMHEKSRKRNIKVALLIATALLLLFLFLGNYLLWLFRISLEDFMVAGGIILLIIGVKLVLGLSLREKRAEKYETAIVPMATPLLTGPAVITAVIISVATFGYAVTFLSAVINLAIAWLVLINTPFFFRILGRQGSDVVSKLFGLILVAMAVSFIRGGV